MGNNYLHKYLSLLVLVHGLTVDAYGKLIEVNRIVAQVNDQIITWGDIDLEYPNNTKEQKKGKAIMYIKGRTDRILSNLAFKEKGMVLPDSYIEKEFIHELNRDFEGKLVDLYKHLKKKKETLYEHKQGIKEKIIYNHMLSRRDRSTNEISPNRVENYYHENRDSFKEPEKRLLQEIEFAYPVDSADPSLKNEALNLYNLLQTSPNRFDELASEYGQSLYKSNQGLWAVKISHSELSTTLRDVAFSLKEGEISEPFLVDLLERKPDGSVAKSGKKAVYIVQVSERESSGIKSLESLRSEIEEMIARELEADSQRRWLSRVKNDAYVRLILPEK